MSNKGYSEAETLRLCKEIIQKARDCQALMGDRTAKFIKAPSQKELMDEQSEIESRVKS